MVTTQASESVERKAEAPRMRIRWLRFFAGLLVFLAAIAAVLFFAPPAPLFTYMLQQAVREVTGRELRVGSANYVLGRTITIELNDVTLTAPAGSTEPDLLKAASIRTAIPFDAVRKRRLELSSLALEAPVLNLARNAQGVGNWTLNKSAASSNPTGTTAPGLAPETSGPTAHPADPSTAAVLALPVTSIRNGTILYSDSNSGDSLRLDTIDANLVVDKEFGGAAAKGSARYSGEKFDFDLVVADVAAAVAGRSTNLTLALDSRHLTARVAGDGAIGDVPMLAGEIDARTPSARDLAGWLGFADSVPPTLGAVTFKGRSDAESGRTTGTGAIELQGDPISYDLILDDIRQAIQGRATAISGKLSARDLKADIDGQIQLGDKPAYEGKLDAATPAIGKLAARLGAATGTLKGWGAGSVRGRSRIEADKLTFDQAEFEADGKTGTFTGTLATAGVRPAISGALSVSLIDIDALAGRAPATGGAMSLEAMPAEQADEGFETTWDALLAELDELQNPPPPPGLQLEAAPKSSYWSDAPIDLKALRNVDLDLDLTADRVKYGSIDVREARVKTKLDNGDLSAQIQSVRIGQGQATGAIDLKARGSQHVAAVEMKLKGVEAEPITYELAGKRLLTGPADVDIRTTATGRSMRQIVSTLDGGARFDMKKGKLRGWDIGQMVEQLWNYKGWGFNPQRSTAFDTLKANYNITAGTMQSAPDLTMRGPTAGLRSQGKVDVPQHIIDQEVKIENLLFNVVVKGDWTKKLWIGPKIFGSVPKWFGASLEAAPPPIPTPPAHVVAKIREVLASPQIMGRMQPAQRAFLQSLLPREPVAQ